MPHIRCKLNDGSEVIFEVEESDLPTGPQLTSRLSDTIDSARDSFEKSLLSIQQLTMQIVTMLKESKPEPPDEIEISLGMKALGEMQAFAVAKASAEANYTLRLRWVRASEKHAGM